MQFTVCRRTAGYDSHKTRNSVNGVIEKLQNGSLHFFVGSCFVCLFFVVGGGDIHPTPP